MFLWELGIVEVYGRTDSLTVAVQTGRTGRRSAAGWPGSRTYRRAYSASQCVEPHLSAIIGIALWRSVLSAVSMLGPLMSHELRYCYPLPTGCYEIDPKLFPPTPSVSGGVQAFTALRKFITITVQRFLRRKKIKEHLLGAQASFLFHSSSREFQSRGHM